MNNKHHELMQVLGELPENKLELVVNVVKALSSKDPAEQKKTLQCENERRKEALRLERAKQENRYREWRTAALDGFRLPEDAGEYDLMSEEAAAILDYIDPGHIFIERTFSAIGDLFDYGFRCGMEYQRNGGGR